MFRIAWLTGFDEGHGEYCLTHELAQAWVRHMSKYNDMMHWIERQTPIEETISHDATPISHNVTPISHAEGIDVFVAEFDDMPNLISASPS